MNDLFKNIHPSKQGILLKMLEANTLHFNVNELILSKIKIDDFIGIIIAGDANIIKTDKNGNKIIIEELSEGNIMTFDNGSNYFRTQSVEELIEGNGP